MLISTVVESLRSVLTTHSTRLQLSQPSLVHWHCKPRQCMEALTLSRTSSGTFESRSYRNISSGMFWKNISVEDTGSYLHTPPAGEHEHDSERSVAGLSSNVERETRAVARLRFAKISRQQRLTTYAYSGIRRTTFTFQCALPKRHVTNYSIVILHGHRQNIVNDTPKGSQHCCPRGGLDPSSKQSPLLRLTSE